MITTCIRCITCVYMIWIFYIWHVYSYMLSCNVFLYLLFSIQYIYISDGGFSSSRHVGLPVCVVTSCHIVRYQSRNVVMQSGAPVRNDCCVSMPQSKIEDNWGTWKTKTHGQMTCGYIKDPRLPQKVLLSCPSTCFFSKVILGFQLASKPLAPLDTGPATAGSGGTLFSALGLIVRVTLVTVTLEPWILSICLEDLYPVRRSWLWGAFWFQGQTRSWYPCLREDFRSKGFIWKHSSAMMVMFFWKYFFVCKYMCLSLRLMFLILWELIKTSVSWGWFAKITWAFENHWPPT